jgi:hypothetical protein
MTPDVVDCFEDDDAGEVALKMEQHQIRRLIVLNRDRRLVGILSLGDLAVHTADDGLNGEVAEAVSEPAEPERYAQTGSSAGLPKETDSRTGEAAMKLWFGSTALLLGLGLGVHLSGFAAAQQVQFACDQNGDGSVDATESRLCTDREFDEIAPGETALKEEQLFAKMTTGQAVAPTFAEIDQNGDGQISGAEWSDFSARRFAGATEAGGGKMTNEDYARWREQGLYVRPAQ